MKAILVIVAVIPISAADANGQPICANDSVSGSYRVPTATPSLVVTRADGRPLSSFAATVQRDSSDSFVTQTQLTLRNTDKTLTLPPITAGSYWLRVRSVGFVAACFRVLLDSSAKSDTVHVALALDRWPFLSGHPAPLIAPSDTAQTDSLENNASVRALKLLPLHDMPLRPDEREFRLWFEVWGDPEYLLAVRQTPRGTTGHLYLLWRAYSGNSDEATRESRTRREVLRHYNCWPVRMSAIPVGDEITMRKYGCEVRFRSKPYWDSIRERSEANHVWDLPDPSALPSDGTISTDGWGITGEVKIGDNYRTYQYINPTTSVSPIPGYAIKLADLVWEVEKSARKAR